MRYHYALVRISKSTHTWRYVSFLLTLDFLCEDIMYGASYNSEEKVKKKKNNGDPDYWGEKIKQNLFPTQRILSTNVAEKENIFVVE